MNKKQQPNNPEAAKLNARGLNLKAHYRHEFPKWMKRLRAKGEEDQFFLDLQRRYEETEASLAQQDLPPGGAQEILSEMYYPVDETPGRLDSPIMH